MSRFLENETLAAVTMEVDRARKKFPTNKHLLAALMEEVGELAKELQEYGPLERRNAEALQVACVALRIYEEGDSDFDV